MNATKKPVKKLDIKIGELEQTSNTRPARQSCKSRVYCI